MIQNIVTFSLGILAAFFLVMWITKRVRKGIDDREDYLSLHGKLRDIGLNRISSLIAQLATGDPWECRRLLKDFQNQMLEADPLWKWWSPTFYALLDEHAKYDWDALQQNLGEIMRTKGKKWRIEFIEVTDTGLDLRQNAGVTVGANPAQAPSVGIMGSNVTEVNTSGAKNVIEQQSQVSTKPVGQTTLGQSLSAEQI